MKALFYWMVLMCLSTTVLVACSSSAGGPSPVRQPTPVLSAVTPSPNIPALPTSTLPSRPAVFQLFLPFLSQPDLAPAQPTPGSGSSTPSQPTGAYPTPIWGHAAPLIQPVQNEPGKAPGLQASPQASPPSPGAPATTPEPTPNGQNGAQANAGGGFLPSATPAPTAAVEVLPPAYTQPAGGQGPGVLPGTGGGMAPGFSQVGSAENLLPRFQPPSLPPTAPTPAATATWPPTPIYAPAPTPVPLIPTPTPIPYPTREAAEIEMAQAAFDLSETNPTPPTGVLPTIQYTPTGGSSVFTCHHPYDFEIGKNDLGFIFSLAQDSLETNMLLYVYACGWQPGELVYLSVQFPDGQTYRQDLVHAEEALSQYASAEGKVYRNYLSQLTDPPGAYTFILSGSGSGREMRKTIELRPWGGPRARVEFIDPWNHLQVSGYRLYGFWPNEPIRGLAYQLEGGGHRGRFIGWSDFQADGHGWLHVSVDPHTPSIDYLFVGDQSGQALNSFSRGGIAPTTRGDRSTDNLAVGGPVGRPVGRPNGGPNGGLMLQVLQWWAALSWIGLIKLLLQD